MGDAESNCLYTYAINRALNRRVLKTDGSFETHFTRQQVDQVFFVQQFLLQPLPTIKCCYNAAKYKDVAFIVYILKFIINLYSIQI